MFYVYKHTRLDNNSVFYIGKGKKSKGYNPYIRAFTKSSRNIHWKRIVKKTKYKVDILFETEIEENAYIKETELIKEYGFLWNNSGTLCNIIKENSEVQIIAREKSIKSCSKKVYRYDLDGNYIDSFKSIVEAKNKYKCDVYNCISGKNITGGGFQWRIYKRKNIGKAKERKCRKIYQYTYNGVFVKTWNGSLEISKYLKLNHTSIRNCLCGLSNTCGSFIFSYTKIKPLKKYGLYKDNVLIISSNKLIDFAILLNSTKEVISVYLRNGKKYKNHEIKHLLK